MGKCQDECLNHLNVSSGLKGIDPCEINGLEVPSGTGTTEYQMGDAVIP